MQIPWLQNISRLLAPLAVPMTSIYGCSLVFGDQVLLNRLAQQRDESLSGCMSEVRVGHSDLVWACGSKFSVVEISQFFGSSAAKATPEKVDQRRPRALSYRRIGLSCLEPSAQGNLWSQA